MISLNSKVSTTSKSAPQKRKMAAFHRKAHISRFLAGFAWPGKSIPPLKNKTNTLFKLHKTPKTWYLWILKCPPHPKVRHKNGKWQRSIHRKAHISRFLAGFAWPGKSIPPLKNKTNTLFKLHKTPKTWYLWILKCPPHPKVRHKNGKWQRSIEKPIYRDFWPVLPDQANRFLHSKTKPIHYLNFIKHLKHDIFEF